MLNFSRRKVDGFESFDRPEVSFGSGRVAMLVLCMVAAAMLLFPMASEANAAEAAASQTKVSIWPEYDDPRVLVIHEADLTDATELPVTVTFNIPKGAEIGMACEVTSSGGHNCKPYGLEDRGDYQALTYTVDSERKIFVEYYYEAFPAGVGDRSFLYDLRPGFPTDSLSLEVQQPARSTEFSVSPGFASMGTDSNGLNYYGMEIASPAVGDVIPVSISYIKPDAKPSIELGAPASAGDDAGSAPASKEGGTGPLMIVLIGVGLAVVGLIAFRTLRPAPATGRGASVRKPKTPDPRGAPRTRGAGSGKRSTNFCTQCGEPLDAGDRFCVSCGTRAR